MWRLLRSTYSASKTEEQPGSAAILHLVLDVCGLLQLPERVCIHHETVAGSGDNEQRGINLMMARLRQGLKLADLADPFKIHPSTASRYITTWVDLMYWKFRDQPSWLSRRKIDNLMPPCFKLWYPSTRVVIDCTEFYVNCPSSLSAQNGHLTKTTRLNA